MIMDDADLPRHLDDEILIDYADDPSSVPNRAAVEAHLDACAACWTKLDDFRLLAEAMRDEETWWITREIADEGRAQALRKAVAGRATEDEEAERLLRPLLDSEYRFRYTNIVRRKAFQTGGVVRLLCRTAHDEVDRNPRFAQAIAETAAAIAEGLPDDYYPAGAVNELRGTAWKEYATACRYLARFDSGFDALNRAERAYRRLVDPGLQIAVVKLARAILLWEQQRYPEALEIVRSAAHMFSERRETMRYFEAKEVEALILQRQGNVADACETYRTIFDLADTIGDLEMRARSARNLGIACRDGGDMGSASKYLLIALQLYESLDQRGRIVHTRWSIARLALSAGNARDAAQRLPALILDLSELGMAADAAHAQLDLAEALLLLERFDEVHDACTSLFAFFRGANMLTGALTAAAFLREAATSGTLTSQHIQRVRTYLSELERHPDLAFAPSSDR
jgi:tetratricopeptide (TPR) repeat protein